MQVSVLDIFGFEVFQTNHFEQFCINFANEKLQLHFNHFNFMLERELYAREGIELVESDFVDNSACVELVEGKGWGIQACLDDVCIMPKGDDQTFLQKMIQTPQIKNSRHFGSPKQSNNSFVVHHYAGAVQYTITDFCEKNKDILADDIVKLLQGSKSKFFQSLFEESAPSANQKVGAKRSGGVAHASVSAVFKRDLQSLMDSINQADPHFVRCVNPNAEKKAYFFQDQKAIEQLRCGGVIEAVRMARESYPTRLVHSEFVGKSSFYLGFYSRIDYSVLKALTLANVYQTSSWVPFRSFVPASSAARTPARRAWPFSPRCRSLRSNTALERYVFSIDIMCSLFLMEQHRPGKLHNLENYSV
jgi:myosin-5